MYNERASMKELLERKYSIEKLISESMGKEKEVMTKTLESIDGKILQEVESGMFTWDDIIDLSAGLSLN